MLEIRICWHPDVVHEDLGVFREGGIWFLDRVEMRRTLMSLLVRLNEEHGADSHWLEERPWDPSLASH